MPPRSSLRQRAATPARSTRASSAVPQDTPARRSTRNTSRQSLAPRDAVSNPALPEIQTQQSYAYGSSKTPALPEQLQARDLSMRAVVNRLDDAAAEAERNLEAHVAEVRGSTPESQTSAREARAQRRASRDPPQPSPVDTPDDSRRRDRTAAWIETSQLEDIQEEKSSQDSPEDEPETPIRDREGSLPSSFPTGSFANHSYSYERGERPPNLPNPEIPELSELPELPELPEIPEIPEERASPERIRQVDAPRRIYTQAVKDLYSNIDSKWRGASQNALVISQNFLAAVSGWIRRMFATLSKSVQEFPDSLMMSTLFKTVFTIAIMGALSFAFCAVWTRFCDANSTSVVSQSLQKVCGSCTTSSISITSWNLTGADSTDISQLIAALQKTQTQIAQIESRLNSRIDSSRASQSSDISVLRTHQQSLEDQIRQLSEHQPKHGIASTDNSNSIPSPLISQINFFSPSNNAVVLPYLTSPTLSHNSSSYFLPIRVALNMIGLRKRIGSPPVAALEPWTEESDRWCAAPPALATPKHGRQTSEIEHLRLGVQTNQKIYPTELVIEHFPSLGSLEPGTTPKDIELWADFSRLSHDEWSKLHITDLITESPTEDSDFFAWLASRSPSPPNPNKAAQQPQTWARIGMATYDAAMPYSNDEEASYEAQEVTADQAYLGQRQRQKQREQTKEKGSHGSGGGGSSSSNHVQRFNLQINQNGLLHYSDRFLLRVKSNYGGDYTCLYRVRLHGLPVG